MMSTFMNILFTLNLLITVLGQDNCPQEQQTQTPNIIDDIIAPGVAEDADRFRLSVFSRVGLSTSQSIIMSPYGLWSVLALAYFGSEGNTRLELERALRLGNNKRNVRQQIENINNNLSGGGEDSGTNIQMKDAAYISSNLPLNQCITRYIDDVQQVNFRKAKSAAKLINDEFSRVTHGKIREIVQPDELAAAKFVLVNGIYFKGDWNKQFSRDRTHRVRFTSDDRKINISEVNLMSIKDEIFNYVADDGLKAHLVEIPYKDKKVSCYFILPDSRKSDTNRVLQTLNYDTFESAIQRMRKTPVDVAVPKFKLTSEHGDNLRQALMEEGIGTMFQSNANFSSFVLNQNLLVDSVNQKAVIELNEEGTVAAAISSLISVRSGPGKPVNFVCNRPFIFIIRHKRTKTTLFAGVIRHPDHLEDAS